MSTYTISNTKLIPNRVFILQKSELENSLSPLYYSTLPKKLNFSKKLKDIAFVNPLRRKPVFADDELVPYVGLPQTDEHSKSIINVILRPYKEVKGRNIIYPNDLLFARIEPSIFNKKYILTKDLKGYDFAFTSTEFYIVKGKDIDNEYLLANFLSDYVYKQVEGKTTGSTGRRRLDKSVFADLVFPFPKSRDRKKVSEIIAKYFALKKQNEAKAKKLLASIDNYLLEELGIKLPELPENTLENRMFQATINSLSSNRYDPYFHQFKFVDNIKAIENGKYPVKELRIIIFSDLIKGTLPKSEEKEGNNSVIQINCINNDGTIYLEKLLTAKDIFSKQQKLKEGDVLVVITGATIGKIAQWIYKGEFYLGGDIVKFQTNTLVDNSFVFHFLRSSPMQLEIKRNVTGATNGHLSPDDIKRFPIPVPPLDKQKEIANHISEIRKQAQKLKDQTAEALKNASNEIERILLN